MSETDKKFLEDNTKCTEKKGFFAHLKSMGSTNRLAVYLVLVLTLGLFMGYDLARRSINADYMGALACFTIVFTPIGTAISIVLNSIVHKSRDENTAGDGTGVKFAAAQAENFGVPTIEDYGTPESPSI